MKAFIITCNGHISSEGFSNLDDAENWILSREDGPRKYQGWIYLAGRNTYKIHEVKINEKENKQE